MGSKSSKKRAKKINPHGKLLKSTKRQTNKETYFESGRIKSLAPGRYYIGHTFSKKEEMIIFITITRKHVNGNISFVIFGIHDKTGWIEKVQYDFNVPCGDFDAFIATTNMVDFEDYEALEHLIFDAEIQSRKNGNLHKDYWLAEKILASDKVINLGERHRLLATFQSPVAGQKVAINERYLANHLGSKFASYEPEFAEKWDRDQWEAFISELPAGGLDPDFSKLNSGNLTPLIYLFEKTELPFLTESKKTTVIFEQLSSQQACYLSAFNKVQIPEDNKQSDRLSLTPSDPNQQQQEVNLFDYEPNEEEHFLQISLDEDMQIEKSKADHLLIIKRIRMAMRKYPENPYFKNLLYAAYRCADEAYAAEKVAVENYKARPDSVHFTLIYLAELEAHGSSARLKRFFKKGYLWEDHFGKEQIITGKNFFWYYQLVAGYFALQLDFASFWHLYHFLTKYPGYNQFLDTRAWLPFQFLIAFWLAQKLDKSPKHEISLRLDKLFVGPHKID